MSIDYKVKLGNRFRLRQKLMVGGRGVELPGAEVWFTLSRIDSGVVLIEQQAAIVDADLLRGADETTDPAALGDVIAEIEDEALLGLLQVGLYALTWQVYLAGSEIPESWPTAPTEYATVEIQRPRATGAEVPTP